MPQGTKCFSRIRSCAVIKSHRRMLTANVQDRFAAWRGGRTILPVTPAPASIRLSASASVCDWQISKTVSKGITLLFLNGITLRRLTGSAPEGGKFFPLSLFMLC